VRRVWVFVAFFACAVACGGSSTPDELADPDVVGHTAAPDGTPYPTTNVGDSIGQVAPDFAMRGYPNANRDGGMQVVSFADLFDPTGKDHKVIYLSVAATWCSACVEEAQQITRALPTYGPKGVVVVEVLVAGASAGYGPSQAELDGWLGTTHATWTVLADVRGRRMNQLGLLGVPSSMLIDARTMKIIHASLGAPNDLPAYLQLGLDWVAKH
jgi:hypothetical protein